MNELHVDAMRDQRKEKEKEKEKCISKWTG